MQHSPLVATDALEVFNIEPDCQPENQGMETALNNVNDLPP